MSKIRPLSSQRKIDRALSQAVTALTFIDNFKCFEAEVTIDASSELAIRNEFDDVIPTRYIITNHVGDGQIRRGDTEWSLPWLYLKNIHASEAATINVLFFAK